MTSRRHFFASLEEMSTNLTTHILACARESIEASGRFSIVLTGGKSVKLTYQKLGQAHADWSKWHVFWNDERCVHTHDNERNSKLAIDEWLSRTSIPTQHIHPIPSELGPVDAVLRYTDLLSTVDIFDLVLLSLGPDGHVASLFPGQVNSRNPEFLPVLSTLASPEFPVENRISLSLQRLRATRRTFIVAWGPSKSDALKAWRINQDLPITRVTDGQDVEVWHSDLLSTDPLSVSSAHD